VRWIVLLHVVTAIGLVAGLVGRDLTLAKARASIDMRSVTELVALAGWFDRFLVQPGSFAVLAAGLLAAWNQHLSFTAEDGRWLLVSLVLFLSIVPLVPLVFLPRGRVFEAALREATERGEVTPALSAAFRDPAVRLARVYEGAVIAVVLTLMVVKPF
jgi:hypothetical protein